MYDNFKILNYSYSLVSPELYARHLSRLFSGNVVDGLLVVPKTGLTVTLQNGNGFIPYGSGATASNREFSLVADFDITLDTADASNPRIDLIVIYVDLAVTLPGGVPGAANLDGPGVVKATFVKGTPNASPVDPTVGAIQTKIGAANPYIIVAAVRVDATVTTIAANKITDRRTFAKVATTNIDKTGLWGDEIGRFTLASASDTIAVPTFPARKHLKIMISTTASGGTVDTLMRFNGDTAANYALSAIYNNAGTLGLVDLVSQTELPLEQSTVPSGGTEISTLEIFNPATSNKQITGQTSHDLSVTTAATRPHFLQISGKWVNAAQITSVSIRNAGTGDFAVGSEVIVLGHD